jgi:gamma-D-glutamyl-L-lysine dipeptidyl-peptidase
LAASLQEKGFDVYYFLHDSNLYKIRFGSYTSLDAVRNIAEGLRSSGIITEYFIVKY